MSTVFPSFYIYKFLIPCPTTGVHFKLLSIEEQVSRIVTKI